MLLMRIANIHEVKPSVVDTAKPGETTVAMERIILPVSEVFTL